MITQLQKLWIFYYIPGLLITAQIFSDRYTTTDPVWEPDWKVGCCGSCPAPVSSEFQTCEISDFTPCTHAQSNILHTKYADKTDY